MSPVSLVNGAFHLHIISTVELDSVCQRRLKSVEFIGKMVFVETGILYVTVLISVTGPCSGHGCRHNSSFI